MNKYKTLIIVLFIIISFSIAKVYAIVNDYTLLGKTICLDAGHGGMDSGAVYNNILEKNINLKIVEKIEANLVSKGANVIQTREGDYDLAKTTKYRKRSDLGNRAKLINSSNCDLYISIHLNAITSSRWSGLQIFYNNKNKNNKVLADTMYKTLSRTTNNIKKTKENNTYYMYKLINKPGILIETGFLSNAHDRYVLTNDKYQEELAKKITLGIENYF